MEIRSTHKDLPKVEGKPQPAPHLVVTVGTIGKRVWFKIHPANRSDLVQFYYEQDIESVQLHVENCAAAIVRIQNMGKN